MRARRHLCRFRGRADDVHRCPSLPDQNAASPGTGGRVMTSTSNKGAHEAFIGAALDQVRRDPKRRSRRGRPVGSTVPIERDRQKEAIAIWWAAAEAGFGPYQAAYLAA